MAVMYCWRTGRLAVGRGAIPNGALMVTVGGEKTLRRILHGFARLAYDNKTWLVPGIPEAKTDAGARRALKRFTKGVNRRLGFYVY